MTPPEPNTPNDEPQAPSKNYKAMFVIAVVVIGINFVGLWFLSKQ